MIFEWGQWPAGEQEPPGVAGLPWTMTSFNWSSSFGDDDNDDHDNDTFDNDDDSDDNDDNDDNEDNDDSDDNDDNDGNHDDD